MFSGNDLARTLGYGSGSDCSENICKYMANIGQFRLIVNIGLGC